MGQQPPSDAAPQPGRLHPSRRAVLTAGAVTAVGGVAVACTPARTQPTATTTASRPSIEQWYHAYAEAGTEQAVRRYAAGYDDAQVAVSWRPREYDRATAAVVGTPEGPDVFEYANGPTIDMIRRGQVVDLTETVGAAATEFQQGIIGRMTHEGRIWAIPQVVDTQFLIYRPSLLGKAGVEPPQTMAELVDACRALTTGSVKGIFLGNGGPAVHLAGPLLWSAGLDFLTDDNRVGFADPRAETALTAFRELYDRDVVLTRAPRDWAEPTALIEGLAAMQFTGLWTFPALAAALEDDFGVLPWPRLDDMGNPSVPLGAFGACVSAASENVDAAKDFVRWLWVERTDLQLDFATAYGLHIPARTSLVAQAEALKSGPAAEAAGIFLEYGVPQDRLLWTPACASAFADLMRAVVGGANARAEIAKAKTVVDAELARVR